MQTITDGTAKFVVRDKRMQALVDMFYPVGTVYATFFGKILMNRRHAWNV